MRVYFIYCVVESSWEDDCVFMLCSSWLRCAEVRVRERKEKGGVQLSVHLGPFKL